VAVGPLCQREGASCGACCGLYNRQDLSRAGVERLLRRRTRVLAETPPTPEAFRDAAARLGNHEEAPLFPSVRICSFLGYLDASESRIGCLAHPLSTGGVDLRDCGVYDARTCGAFFCPSHSWLSEEEAEIVAQTCAGDPYLYGLAVTDVPFLRAALQGVARLAGRSVGRRNLDNERFRAALRRLFALKEELTPGSEGLFGAFQAGADGEPIPRMIDYAVLGRGAASPYDEILRCVGADPRSGNDLEVLEDEVRTRLESCARALG